MKRVAIITAAIALVLLAAASLRVWNANPTVSWRAFERQFPGVLQRARVRELACCTEASEQVALPLALRVRQSLSPRPPPSLVIGFPESVEHFTVESARNRCHMECLVRYSRGMVARVILRYPSAAKREAARVGDGLRKLSDSFSVNLCENIGS